MFQYILKAVSREFQGYFKGFSRVFQKYFKAVSRVFYGCLMGVLGFLKALLLKNTRISRCVIFIFILFEQTRLLLYKTW